MKSDFKTDVTWLYLGESGIAPWKDESIDANDPKSHGFYLFLRHNETELLVSKIYSDWSINGYTEMSVQKKLENNINLDICEDQPLNNIDSDESETNSQCNTANGDHCEL